MAERIQEAASHQAPLAVLDIPLLYESKLDAGLRGVIVVWSTPEQQLERATTRGGEASDMAARIAAQMPLSEKRARATWVIDNSGAAGRRGARSKSSGPSWLSSASRSPSNAA